MSICRICGEMKNPDDFKVVPKFTKFKKQRVQWCEECQRMYIQRGIEKRKKRERIQKLKTLQRDFQVSFE